jgi:hypothetical protein
MGTLSRSENCRGGAAGGLQVLAAIFELRLMVLIFLECVEKPAHLFPAGTSLRTRHRIKECYAQHRYHVFPHTKENDHSHPQSFRENRHRFLKLFLFESYPFAINPVKFSASAYSLTSNDIPFSVLMIGLIAKFRSYHQSDQLFSTQNLSL